MTAATGLIHLKNCVIDVCVYICEYTLNVLFHLTDTVFFSVKTVVCTFHKNAGMLIATSPAVSHETRQQKPILACKDTVG